MYANMSFGVVDWGNSGRLSLTVGWDSQQEEANFFGGGIGEHNVGLTYRKNVALPCRCSILEAERLDLSTVCTAQL